MAVPIWQGVAFAAAGLAVVLLTPKYVASQAKRQDRFFRWQAKLFGLEQTAYVKAVDSDAFKRWRRFTSWFGPLVFAAMLVAVGVAMLFHLPGFQ